MKTTQEKLKLYLDAISRQIAVTKITDSRLDLLLTEYATVLQQLQQLREI